MNYGPIIFLAAFFTLAASWFGLVLSPSLQVGHLQQTNSPANSAMYPLARPGFATEGADVYRANGCASCHGQQIHQQATVFDVYLAAPGTNQALVNAAIQKLRPGLNDVSLKELLTHMPARILEGQTPEEAQQSQKVLAVGGAEPLLWVVPLGPDIARGWGRRQSVAQDFLYDNPVMLGSQRSGPDLANVGERLPDESWHLLHLYAPRLQVPGSTMPSFRFLFEKRKIHRTPSSDALPLMPPLAPPDGYEIVPKAEARALAAYLTSLRADAPLYVAPMSVLPPPPATTNAPAATNAPAGKIVGEATASTNAGSAPSATNKAPPTPAPATNKTSASPAPPGSPK